jgi:hypothetical protein
MRLFFVFITVLCMAALCLCAPGQIPPSPQNKDAQSVEMRGTPPRASPGDYQAHAAAGTVTVAAEFLGHSVPTEQGTYNSEDYVAVETGLYGQSGARLKISVEDFSLRINEKKAPVPAQPFGAIFRSLKDPEWVPPETEESKSKGTGISTGGRNAQSDGPPPPPKMPLDLQRAMQQHVQKAAIPEGDRALPQAGLIFFPFHGKAQAIRSLELTYSGPAGQVTLTLQP